MADVNVTDTDIEALATKLEGMADRFSEHERATMHALFHLAGIAVTEATAEVEGFGVGTGGQPASFSWGADQGILIGLNQTFVAGRHGGASGVGGSLQHKFWKVTPNQKF